MRNLVWVALLAAGCGSSDGSSAAKACTSSADCGSLSCVSASMTDADGGCVPDGQTFCGLACTTNADCAPLGPSYFCDELTACSVGVCLRNGKV